MAEQVFKKEVDGYYGSVYRDDFCAQDEIMVHITLHEYRELVTDKAKHAEALRLRDERVSEANKERDAAKAQLQGILEKLGIESGEEEQ